MSSAVNASPSFQVTPSRAVSATEVKSSDHAMSDASHGTMSALGSIRFTMASGSKIAYP
jgi:hypothetical protein